MADKGIWQGYPLDADGNIIPGAEITIRDLNDNIVNLWEDEDGNVTKSNPFQADANGYTFAYANTGYYNIEAEAGTANTTLNKVWIQAEDDDPIRIANGTSSYKVVYSGLNLSNDLVQSDIANNAIGQGELKTTSGSVSVSSENTARRTLPGGQYGFAPECRANNGSNNDAAFMFLYGLWDSNQGGWTGLGNNDVQFQPTTYINSQGQSAGYSQYVTIGAKTLSDNDTSNTAYMRQRYIQSSPPYDLGNGDIPLFIFAHMLPNGDIGGLYVAEDPPWANNGPTDIRSDWIDPKTGRAYKARRKVGVTMDDVRNGKASLAEIIEERRRAEIENIEITQEIKQADMHLHPHSWVDTPKEGEIVLLDPCCDKTLALHELHKDGEDVLDIIHSGYFKIKQDDCGANCPPGTRAVRYQIK